MIFTLVLGYLMISYGAVGLGIAWTGGQCFTRRMSAVIFALSPVWLPVWAVLFLYRLSIEAVAVTQRGSRDDLR